jgi:hypothetical protein
MCKNKPGSVGNVKKTNEISGTAYTRNVDYLKN